MSITRKINASQWVAENPTLRSGEVGIEKDTKKQKIGDGVTRWNELSYQFNKSISDANYINLKQAAKNPDILVVGVVNVNGSNQVTSASVLWPDGTPGVFTITARHATGAVTNYNITYGSPVTKTFTQPTITRNAAGVATNIPQIVVS